MPSIPVLVTVIVAIKVVHFLPNAWQDERMLNKVSIKRRRAGSLSADNKEIWQYAKWRRNISPRCHLSPSLSLTWSKTIGHPGRSNSSRDELWCFSEVSKHNIGSLASQFISFNNM